MKNVRYEGSLLTSLEELKQIELQRQAEEAAAVEAVALARRRDHEATLQLVRDRAEAKVLAEHAAKLAVEQARLEAEREVRLRVEATEAAEQASHQIALDQARLVGELELRRAEVARKRPRWMLAVTILAAAGVAIMLALVVQSQRAADDAIEGERRADVVAGNALAELERARANLSAIEHRLTDLEQRINAGISVLTSNLTQAEQREASQQLHKLEAERAATRRAQLKAQQDLEDKIRAGGFTMDEACARNPLCPKPKK